MKAVVHHQVSLQAKINQRIEHKYNAIRVQTGHPSKKSNARSSLTSTTLESPRVICEQTVHQHNIETRSHVQKRTFVTIPPFPPIFKLSETLNNATNESKRYTYNLDRDLPSQSPEIVILGSGAGEPTAHRMCSNYALRLGTGETYLFDCGESCHLQMKKSNVRLSSISRIFVTHLHGDHFFGILSAALSITKARGDYPLSIYGPVGIRKFFRTYTQMAKSWGSIHMPTVFIHELHTPAFQHLHEQLELVPGTGERDIRVGATDSVVVQEPHLTVRCGLMEHMSIPCFGYVVTEKDIPGTVLVDKIKSLGLQPGAWIRSLKAGTITRVSLPDGSVIDASELMTPPRKGKKIVILGDTCNSDLIASTAEDCDSVVHECTLREVDIKKAKTRGHSTPSMAAKFAANIKAKQLILSHFGQSHTNEMAQAEKEAEEIAQKHFSGNIVIAQDLMTVEIKRDEEQDKPTITE